MVLFSSFNHFNILLLFLYLGITSGIVFFLVYNIANFIRKSNISYIKQNKQNTIKKDNLQKDISTTDNIIVENLESKNTQQINSLMVFEKNEEKLTHNKNLKFKKRNKENKNADVKKSQKSKEQLKAEKLKLKQEKKAFRKNLKAQKKQNNLIKKQKLKHFLLKLWQQAVITFKRAQNILLTVLCIVTLITVVLGSYYINFVLNYGYLRIVFIAVWCVAFMLGGYVQKKVAKILVNFYNKFCKQVKKSSN